MKWNFLYIGILLGLTSFAAEMPRQLPPEIFKKGERILFIGDSISEGGRRSDMNHYLGHGYVAEIAMRYLAYRPELDLQFFNRAVSGESSSNLVARWTTDAIPVTPNEAGYDGPYPNCKDKPVIPDWMNLQVGCNDDRRDCTVPITEYEPNMRYMLDSALKANPKMKIVVCEEARPLDESGKEMCTATTPQRRAILRKLVEEYNLIYVPFNGFIQNTLMREKPQMKWWIWDKAHPTYAAHMRMADFWLKEVSEQVVAGRGNPSLKHAKCGAPPNKEK